MSKSQKPLSGLSKLLQNDRAPVPNGNTVVGSTCNRRIYSAVASWAPNTTYASLWGAGISCGTFSAVLPETLPHCVWGSEVHSLLRL